MILLNHTLIGRQRTTNNKQQTTNVRQTEGDSRNFLSKIRAASVQLFVRTDGRWPPVRGTLSVTAADTLGRTTAILRGATFLYFL